jgi:hypothetical protein
LPRKDAPITAPVSRNLPRQIQAGGTLITDDRPYTEHDLLRHRFGP